MLLHWFGLLFVIAGIPYVLYLGASRLVSPSDSPAKKRKVVEPVSIVLPTYNEEAIVEDSLERLCALSYPNNKIELVVIDSSDDETADVIREFFGNRESPALNLIEEGDRGGVARAVNRGVEAASHDVIFRTDCDSTLGKDVLQHAVANLQDQRIGGVTGRQTDVLGGSKVEEDYRNLQSRNQALESALDSTFIVHGPCFAFRRDYFEKITPDSLADDSEIGVNIRKQGKRVVMDPKMVFAEVGVSDIRERRNRKDRRAMGLLQLLFKNRDILGQYGMYGWIIVPFNWFFLVVSPWLTVILLAIMSVTLLAFGGLLGIFALGASMIVVFALGHRDRLGPAQPLYAVLDSQLSLLIAFVRLFREERSGTWEIDTDSRERFQDET